MKRLIVWLPLAALAALAALFAVYALNRDPQVTPQAMVGKPVPAVALPGLDGASPRSLAEVAGEGPVLINFFASWCAPCEFEHPRLTALKARGVRIVGVAYKDAPQNSQAFLMRLGDPFERVVIDRQGTAGIEFGLTGVPETYAVDARGIIVGKFAGPLDAVEAERLAALAAR
ncbi:MAG TPA: DsbE family thiol:disulfide interchange protein [Phenylobacterium sp.]|nr:DsbE family thiol:disulfide interchange protein [Phenylobacterium sp.]